MSDKESKILLYIVSYKLLSSNSYHHHIVISSNFALTFTCIKAKRCSFCCLWDRHRGKQHQKKRGDVDCLSRKTWRRFEKKRSMFLLLQISHLDNKNVWFLCKSVMLLCCYVIMLCCIPSWKLSPSSKTTSYSWESSIKSEIGCRF